MRKQLQIIGLGIFTWVITLAWLEFNAVLMSPLMIGGVLVLAVALPAYSLGRHMGLRTIHFEVVRGLRSQLPQTRPVLVSRQLHANPTRPVASTRRQEQHSQSTQPLPMVAPH
jgi:hypothetical protein